MINYIEKGIGMHRAIYRAGFGLFGRMPDGRWVANMQIANDATNDAAVQAIINAYDPLPDYKADGIAQIRATAVQKFQTLFPAIPEGVIEALAALWQSLSSSAKGTNTAKWSSAIAVYQATVNGIAAVNAATTQAGVQSAVAAVAWPF